MTTEWAGSEALRSMLVRVDSLIEDERNARRHAKGSIAAIAASLQRFGQRKPIVTRDGRVTAGNGTLLAARSLGWGEIAATDASDLTPEQARAYALADNQTALLATWDYDALRTAMAEMSSGDAEATGFTPDEIRALASSSWSAPDGAGDPDLSAAPATTAMVVAQYRATEQEAVVIRAAIEQLKAREGRNDIAEGRALELICADYLAGSDDQAGGQL